MVASITEKKKEKKKETCSLYFCCFVLLAHHSPSERVSSEKVFKGKELAPCDSEKISTLNGKNAPCNSVVILAH